MLRLTVLLSLLALPLVLTRILSFHQRQRVPSSLLDPTVESLIMAAFPVAWFFGFLYYTDVPSLVSVLLTVAMAIEDRHWLAGLVSVIYWHGVPCGRILFRCLHFVTTLWRCDAV